MHNTAMMWQPRKRGYCTLPPYRYRILLRYRILHGYYPIHNTYVSSNFRINKKEKNIDTWGIPEGWDTGNQTTPPCKTKCSHIPSRSRHQFASHRCTRTRSCLLAGCPTLPPCCPHWRRWPVSLPLLPPSSSPLRSSLPSSNSMASTTIDLISYILPPRSDQLWLAVAIELEHISSNF
jgi:hypothetical protein